MNKKVDITRDAAELMLQRRARLFCEEAIINLLDTHPPEEALHFLSWWMDEILEDMDAPK